MLSSKKYMHFLISNLSLLLKPILMDILIWNPRNKDKSTPQNWTVTSTNNGDKYVQRKCQSALGSSSCAIMKNACSVPLFVLELRSVNLLY